MLEGSYMAVLSEERDYLREELKRREAEAAALRSLAGRMAEALKAMQMEARARNCGLRITDEVLAEYEAEYGAKECRHGMPNDWNCNACSDSGYNPTRATNG